MKKDAFSRRQFLKVAATVGVVGTTASFFTDAWGDGKGALSAAKGHVSGGDRGHQKGKDKLKKELEATFNYNVRGVERNNRIGQRLAANLVEIGGRSSDISEQRKDLLLRAVEYVRENQNRVSDNAKRTVTQNLNDLLAAIRNELVPSDFANSFINAFIVTVLFATHGTHFDDTSYAHRQFRRKLLDLKLALKRRDSAELIGQLIGEKKSSLQEYRAAIANYRAEVFSSGKFPEQDLGRRGPVIIRSVWIMRRARGARRV